MQLFDDCGYVSIISHSTVNASSIYRLVENNFDVSIVPTPLNKGHSMKMPASTHRFFINRKILEF